MRRLRTAALLGVLLALAPAAARAQDKSGSRFGKRDSFAFTAENLLGYVSTSVGSGDTIPTFNTLGVLPPYWGDIGLFSMSSSGLNLGALVGFQQLVIPDAGDVTVLKLRPRIGWAFSKQDTLGFWVRGGPSFMMFRSSSGDESDSGDAASGSATAAMLALGLEAYAVIMPVEHVGILFGPHAEIHAVGSASKGDDPSYSSQGLSFGLMGEIW